jgi:small subunit ribosomal protein S17
MEASSLELATGKAAAGVTVEGFDVALARPYVPSSLGVTPTAGRVSLALEVKAEKGSAALPRVVISGNAKLEGVAVLMAQATDPFVKVATVTITIKDAEPLDGVIALDTVTIDTVDLKIARDAQGQVDLLALAQRPAQAPATSEAPAAAAEAPAAEGIAEEKAPAEAPAPVPAAPAVQSEPKRKKKRLPRRLRRERPKAKRGPTAERKPIVRQPKPEGERGRRQERRGVVVSASMDKTIVVRVDTVKAHPRYKKIVRRTSKFHAHDEGNRANVGDLVLIVETRPLSKTKRWRLAEIVQEAK